MVRPFSPSSIAINPDVFKQMRETALMCTGEWVRHIPCEGNPQWIVLHFQHMPEQASINPEYVIYSAESSLWGLADHFEIIPTKFSEGHSGKPKRGSQVEVQGYLYNVMGAPVNHRGYIRVYLCRADKCTEPRAEFCIEAEAQSPC